jgi:catechol 2,3-dioxygenase-like lactoylglutathione lyase family enzyme
VGVPTRLPKWPSDLLGPPVQIAYAVADVHAGAKRWQTSFGAGPFIISEHIALASARVGGEERGPLGFDHSSAYGQWGEVMVELVHEHTAPIGATTGLHHVAFFVDDIGATSSALTAAGWPEALWATTGTGTAFAMHDARNDLGHLIELYEPSAGLLAFYAKVKLLASAHD